jgi:hypothetical protein
MKLTNQKKEICENMAYFTKEEPNSKSCLQDANKARCCLWCRKIKLSPPDAINSSNSFPWLVLHESKSLVFGTVVFFNINEETCTLPYMQPMCLSKQVSHWPTLDSETVKQTLALTIISRSASEQNWTNKLLSWGYTYIWQETFFCISFLANSNNT